MVFNRSSSTATTVDLVLRDLLGMEDLYHNLDVLEDALKEKNERYHHLVEHLQTDETTDHDAIVQDLQHQFEDLYRMQLRESTEEQSRQTQAQLDDREKYWRDHVAVIERQATNRETTSLKKAQWLAEQLHQTKQGAHKRQLLTEQAARSKHDDLHSRLVEAQEKLESHVRESESKKLVQQKLWNERQVLRKEADAVKSQLSESIQQLKQAAQAQLLQNAAERERQRIELSSKEAQLQGQLQAVRDHSIAEVAKLKLALQGRQDEIAQALAGMREQFRARETVLENELKQVRDELHQQQINSKSLLEAEKARFEQREASLRGEMQQKELEIDRHRKEASIRSAEAHGLRLRREEMEKEVAALRQDYVKSVSEWEAKVSAERELLQTKLRRQQDDFERKQTSAQTVFASAVQDATSYKEDLARAIAETNTENRKVLDRLRAALSEKVKDFARRLRNKEDELQASRVESQRILMGFKNASMAEQARILRELRQRESDLQQQVNLTTSISEKASEHLHRRVELEGQLSRMKREYDAARLGWKSKVAELEVRRMSELQAAVLLFAKNEAETDARMRSNRDTFTMNQTAWEERLSAQESHYQQLIQDLKIKSDQEKHKLLQGVQAVRDELHRYKNEIGDRLASQKMSFQSKQSGMLAAIAEREAKLQKQEALTKTMAETSKSHWQIRMTLESQLSSLKYEFNSSMLEWEENIKVLQRDRGLEQKRMEEKVARLTEMAREEVERVRQEAEAYRFAFEKTIAANVTMQRRAFENLLRSSKEEEFAMKNRIDSLLNELQEHKAESERQAAAARLTADSKQTELTAQISVLEAKLRDQVSLTIATDEKAKNETERRRKLESELDALKAKFNEQVAQWQTRFEGLKSSSDKAIHEAESLLARKEVESQEIIERLKREAEAAKASYIESSSVKEREFNMRVQAIQATSQMSVKEVQDQLRRLSDSYLQLKLDSQKSRDHQRQESIEQQDELRRRIQEKEAELAHQVNVTTQHASTMESLRRRIADLEQQITALQREHKSELSALESRFRGLRDSQLEERRQASEKIASITAEADQKVQKATEELGTEKAKLESLLRDQASQHSKALRDIADVSKAKEAGLFKKLHALEALQRTVETNAVQKLDSQAESAVSMKKNFEGEIQSLLRETASLKEKLATEESKSQELHHSSANLRSEFQDLQSRYDNEVREWRGRYNDLVGTLEAEKRNAAEQLALKDAATQQRVNTEIEAAQALRQSMIREMEDRDAKYRIELKALQERATTEDDLRSRLEDVTAQFERYKSDSQMRITDATIDDYEKLESVRDDPSRRQEPSSSFSPSLGREAERVRYDLTKQLVRKNVELLRQQAEIREKEAQIAALKSGRPIEEAGAEVVERRKRGLFAIKERIARLFFRSDRHTAYRPTAPSSYALPHEHSDARQRRSNVLVPETAFW